MQPHSRGLYLLLRPLVLFGALAQGAQLRTRPPREDTFRVQATDAPSPSANVTDDVVMEAAHLAPEEERDITFRPNAGAEADAVEIGVVMRALYSVDMKDGTFTADLIVARRWKDPRNAHFVKKGHKRITLSSKAAKESIWVPDVGITNHAPDGEDTVSSVVMIEPSGLTTKVERVLAVLTNTFDSSAFPFDNQTLLVTVGSTTYGADDLTLVPVADKTWTFVPPEVFRATDYHLNDYELLVIDDVDGFLTKSRGLLRMSVSRDPTGFISGTLVPEILILAVSYSVFWFPLTAPFAMPRVATALIAFLSLLTMALKTNAMLNRNAGLTWIDLFESTAQGLMFFTVCLNILTLASFHSFEAHHVAQVINAELMCGFPLLVLVVFGVCAWKRDGTMLDLMTLVNQLIMFVAGAIYIAWCLVRLWRETQQKAMTRSMSLGSVPAS
eukprot:TRINITY_DN93206_c0_g1_i1.p1 TRINITY_DN93206_c0_g1~~TRINITY_DN93206_c0_g1_i1.p1  ORF type:complete len:442 (-),score=61.05 TRINITY_DN93206_c0_g1_i1:275-1600(-)